MFFSFLCSELNRTFFSQFLVFPLLFSERFDIKGSAQHRQTWRDTKHLLQGRLLHHTYNFSRRNWKVLFLPPVVVSQIIRFYKVLGTILGKQQNLFGCLFRKKYGTVSKEENTNFSGKRAYVTSCTSLRRFLSLWRFFFCVALPCPAS